MQCLLLWPFKKSRHRLSDVPQDGMMPTDNIRQSHGLFSPIELEVFWGDASCAGLQCGHLEEHRTAPSRFRDAADRGDVQFASSALPNAAEIAVNWELLRRCCWSTMNMSILMMLTFFWLHFCTWPRRSLQPHLYGNRDGLISRFPQPKTQYRMKYRGKNVARSLFGVAHMLKISQQRVIARHGTKKLPLRSQSISIIFFQYEPFWWFSCVVHPESCVESVLRGANQTNV